MSGNQIPIVMAKQYWNLPDFLEWEDCSGSNRVGAEVWGDQWGTSQPPRVRDDAASIHCQFQLHQSYAVDTEN